MTPSQQAKQYGCKSLAQVSELSGTPIRTLADWHVSRPQLFAVVCAGCVALTTEAESNE